MNRKRKELHARGGLNVYDQAARYSLRPDPLGFCRWLVLGLDPALRFHGWLDTRTLPFPGTRDRICDTVADLGYTAGTGPRWAFLTEFQTEPEPDIVERDLEYAVRLRRQLRYGPTRREKYQVIAALVSLTGPSVPGTLEMALPGLASPALRFGIAVRTMRDEDAALTLDQIASGETSRGLLCWISLMRGGGEPGIIDRWKQLASQEPSREYRADYGAIVTIFAELTGWAGIWKSKLEDWNMRESTLVSEWRAEWLAEGKAEGLAEGKAEGIVEAMRNNLLEALELRFGDPAPPDLRAMITDQADVVVLSRWFKAALKAQTLDAFRAELAG